MYNRNHLSSLAASVLIALALIFSGCGSTDSGSDDSDNNNDSDPPPSSSASFESGTVPPNGTFSYTFEEEEEVEYYCEFHVPDMQGKIIVTSNVEAVERDTVIMEGMSFVPEELSVAPSTEVIWINESDLDHTVTSGNPSSSSDSNDPGY